MPSSLLGEMLEKATPEPPQGIDVTALLRRSRSRRRARSVLVVVMTAAATAGGIVTIAGSVDTRSDKARPGATQLPSPKPSPDASPDVAPAPDARGMDIDAALATLQRGNCTGTERVVHAAARVGQVVAQSTTPDVCHMTLTVSAGPDVAAPACTTLAVVAGPVGSGLGHSGFAVNFRNTGTTPCVLQGYPDVTATESQTGRSIVARQTPDGYLGSSAKAAKTYVLAVGDHVSAFIEGTNNPAGTATSCTQLNPFQINVNGTTETLDVTLTNCSGIEAHHFVPGTSGSAR